MGILKIEESSQRISLCCLTLPQIIFDEVFTGFWRLGRESARDILGVDPDIACYSKLLSGGALPLGLTVTTDSVFSSFFGDSKAEALLHGSFVISTVLVELFVQENSSIF